ncbi:integrase [Gossypium australe]|uniref:Integrase n=1 Tax=Gossypium australe TaxID=47621 RepID=A0A5B6UKE7_9ROSI|nr:integrase [Gossypium australe]
MEIGTQHDGFCIKTTVDFEEERCHLVRTDYTLRKLSELCVSEIVRLHGVPLSTIFYRDPRFTSKF